MGNKNYNNNESKSPLNANNESSSKYELKFHFPLFKNDCINSIDIFNDKVAIGTIMGYVFLLRVDENNLDVKEKDEKLISSDNSYSEKSNKINYDESSRRRNKKSHKKLKINDEVDKNLINGYVNKKMDKMEETKDIQTKDNSNDISKMKNNVKKIKMIRLNNKKEEISNQNSSTISIKKRKIKIKNIVIKDINKAKEHNKMQDLTNVEDEEEEEKNNEKFDEKLFNKEPSIKEKYSESIKSKEKNNDSNSKKFPRISKLLDEALENICCINFDTEKFLNISIGDLEIIRMLNINMFNMNDSNSTLNYMKIKNYDNSNLHFKYCEKAICMMTSTNYLIIFLDFGNFLSELSEEKARYDNINLIANRKTSGKIIMHNYSVPFDFDGEDFLFVDFLSKEEREICLFDTIRNKFIYCHSITKNFGHISHMKILMNKEKKIFLCRNDLHCEIHLLDDDFTCVEYFEHIGDDIINIFIYFKESKIDEEFKTKIKKEKKNLNLNGNNYDDIVKINNNKLKINKLKDDETEEFPLAKIIGKKINNNSNNNNNNNNNNVLNVYTSSKKKNSEKKSKEIKLDIKDDSDNSSIKETNSHQNKLVLKDSSIRVLNKESMKEESKVENIDEDNFKEKNKNKKDILKIKNEEERQSTVEIKDENDDMEYYIFILDNNGNMNMYKNKKNITLFNLYNVKGIDESYKEKKFFSVGYPYYFVLNELYFAITTDYGLFVTSNSNKEF